jgi:hypothetical protein
MLAILRRGNLCMLFSLLLIGIMVPAGCNNSTDGDPKLPTEAILNSVESVPILKIIPYREGRLWGFVDTKGNKVVKAKYTSAYLDVDGYGKIIMDDLMGLVSPEGDIILEPRYSYIAPFRNNLAAFTIAHELYGYIDVQGKEVIPARYNMAYDFEFKRAIVKKGDSHILIDAEGREVKNLGNLGYGFSGNIEGAFIEVEKGDTDAMLVSDSKSYKYGLIDTLGNILIPPVYEQLTKPLNGTLVAVNSGRSGLLRKDGTTLTSIDFDYIDRGQNNRYIAARKGKTGILDRTGKEILPFQYEYIYQTPSGNYIITTGTGSGLLDSNFNTIIEPVHYTFYEERALFVFGNQAGKSGVMDQLGNVLIPMNYENVMVLSGNSFLAMKGGKVGMLDKNHRTLLPFEFDKDAFDTQGDAYYHSSNYSEQAIVLLRQKQHGWLYNNQGKKISNDNWWYISPPDNLGLIMATNASGLLSYVDKNGKIYSKDIERKLIKVSNVQELLNAIGPDTEIVLKPGEYQLAEMEIKNEYVTVQDIYGEKLFTISNLQNLVIRAEVVGKTEIITSAIYQPVIKLVNSNNVQLHGLTIGHKPNPGYCEGAVLLADNVNHLVIEKCDLYGSGTVGLEAMYSSHCKISNTTIRECTYGLLTLVDSRDMGFYNCRMIDSKDLNMVEITRTEGLVFESVDFVNNHSGLEFGPFYFFNSASEFDKFTLKDCNFENCSSDYFASYKHAVKFINTSPQVVNTREGLYYIEFSEDTY